MNSPARVTGIRPSTMPQSRGSIMDGGGGGQGTILPRLSADSRLSARFLTPQLATDPTSPSLADGQGAEGPSGRGAGRRGLVTALVLAAAAACIVAVLLVLPAARTDPYTRRTLELHGSAENGARLFMINCAGCHGIAAQGLVGPDLHGVSNRRNQRQLIQQVVSGRTPPMPRFQPEPQAMADLLAYLNSLV
jgi:mono/diheme cytochrome c family protein